MVRNASDDDDDSSDSGVQYNYTYNEDHDKASKDDEEDEEDDEEDEDEDDEDEDGMVVFEEDDDEGESQEKDDESAMTIGVKASQMQHISQYEQQNVVTCYEKLFLVGSAFSFPVQTSPLDDKDGYDMTELNSATIHVTEGALLKLSTAVNDGKEKVSLYFCSSANPDFLRLAPFHDGVKLISNLGIEIAGPATVQLAVLSDAIVDEVKNDDEKELSNVNVFGVVGAVEETMATMMDMNAESGGNREFYENLLVEYDDDDDDSDEAKERTQMEIEELEDESIDDIVEEVKRKKGENKVKAVVQKPVLNKTKELTHETANKDDVGNGAEDSNDTKEKVIKKTVTTTVVNEVVQEVETDAAVPKSSKKKNDNKKRKSTITDVDTPKKAKRLLFENDDKHIKVDTTSEKSKENNTPAKKQVTSSEKPKENTPGKKHATPSETPKENIPAKKHATSSETPKEDSSTKKHPNSSETPKENIPAKKHANSSKTPKENTSTKEHANSSETSKEDTPAKEHANSSETSKEDTSAMAQVNINGPETPETDTLTTKDGTLSETSSKTLSKSQRKKLAKRKAKELREAIESQQAGHGDTEKKVSLPVEEPKEKSVTSLTKERRLAEGLLVRDILVGNGPIVKTGRKVSITYKGCLSDTKKVFDKNLNKNKPLIFRIGTGEVIAGLERGLEGMKVGGERIITVSPELGYGKQGSGAKIPGNATLEFTVQVVDVGGNEK